MLSLLPQQPVGPFIKTSDYVIILFTVLKRLLLNQQEQLSDNLQDLGEPDPHSPHTATLASLYTGT
jgi:hypothetical protein